MDSKAFDNSLLCSAESVLILEAEIRDRVIVELTRAGGHICTTEETDRLRSYLFPDGHLNTQAVGQSAAVIARGVGIRTSPRTRALVAPIALVIPEEPLASEKMCPVLGLNVRPTRARPFEPPGRCCASQVPAIRPRSTARILMWSWRLPNPWTYCGWS